MKVTYQDFSIVCAECKFHFYLEATLYEGATKWINHVCDTNHRLFQVFFNDDEKGSIRHFQRYNIGAVSDKTPLRRNDPDTALIIETLADAMVYWPLDVAVGYDETKVLKAALN